MVKRGLLVVFSGPSGVGKNTVLKAFMPMREDCAVSVSATTRAPRPGEVNGLHYHFMSKEEFLSLAGRGEMLEYAEYSGNYYGTPKKPVEDQLAAGKNVILEIEPVGAGIIREKCPDAVFVFLAPPSMRELRQRLEERGTETEESVVKRISAGITELEMSCAYDYVIINDSVQESCQKLNAVITAAACAACKMTDFIREVSLNA